jgi:hypothetical protein
MKSFELISETIRQERQIKQKDKYVCSHLCCEAKKLDLIKLKSRMLFTRDGVGCGGR